jgi:hypothetical protein
LALTFRTLNPLSSLAKVTRSISPERLSGSIGDVLCVGALILPLVV